MECAIVRAPNRLHSGDSVGWASHTKIVYTSDGYSRPLFAFGQWKEKKSRKWAKKNRVRTSASAEEENVSSWNLRRRTLACLGVRLYRGVDARHAAQPELLEPMHQRQNHQSATHYNRESAVVSYLVRQLVSVLSMPDTRLTRGASPTPDW